VTRDMTPRGAKASSLRVQSWRCAADMPRTAGLTRLSDVAVVKLFRLIRLARRLFELPSDRAT